MMGQGSPAECSDERAGALKRRGLTERSDDAEALKRGSLGGRLEEEEASKKRSRLEERSDGEEALRKRSRLEEEEARWGWLEVEGYGGVGERRERAANAVRALSEMYGSLYEVCERGERGEGGGRVGVIYERMRELVERGGERVGSVVRELEEGVEEVGERVGELREAAREVLGLYEEWVREEREVGSEERWYRMRRGVEGALLRYRVSSHVDPVTRQLNMSREEVGENCRVFGAQRLVEAVSWLIAQEEVGFPYKAHFIESPERLFENLREYRAQVVCERFELPEVRFASGSFFRLEYEGKCGGGARWLVVKSREEDYAKVDILTDYFQEKARLMARRRNCRVCPLEWWRMKRNHRNVVQCLLREGRPLNTWEMREEVYKRARECTLFKPTLTKAVIEHLGGSRVLDFSAGWGDRLIGAIGTGCVERYLGVDPNLRLKEGHDEIIRRFASEEARESGAYRVLYEPFERVELPSGFSADLVFTSPPYFDFEIYAEEEGQSVVEYPRFEKWCVAFLFASIEKAWGVLEAGGHLAVHLVDIHESRCCEPMNLFVQSRLACSVYEGVIASIGAAQRPRPIWVWRKESEGGLTEEQRARAGRAEEYGREHFPRIWEMLRRRG